MNILERYRLDPPAAEEDFRVRTAAADSRMAAGLTLLAVVFLTVSLPVTLALRDEPGTLRLVWGIRCVAVAIAAATFVLVRRVASPRDYDRIVTVWLVVWVAAIVAENALMPPGNIGFISWDVFITVGIYAAVPLALGRQLALATTFSVADLLVLWAMKSPPGDLDLPDITLAYACANVVGVFVSRERHLLRRRTFVALRDETRAKTDLEAALAEVRTLQGIIPICAHCKNVRTDAGEWQQVEAYVRAHSEARFSHGICPSCMKLHYPDVPGD